MLGVAGGELVTGRPGRSVAWPVLAWSLYAAIAIAGWILLPAGGFWINDEGIKYLQTIAILTSPDGSSEARLDFSPDETEGLLPHTPVYLWKTTRGYRFLYPDVFARLAALPHRLGGETGMRLLPLLAGLVAVGAWTLAGRRHAPRAAPFVPVLVLASPWMFYHWVFWEHTLALAMQTGSLVLFLWGWRRRRRDALLLAGIVLGLGAFLRGEIVLYAVALAFGFGLAFRDWRRPAAALAGVAIPLTGILLLNVQQWGHPLGLHYAGLALASAMQETTRWHTIKTLIVGMPGEPLAAVAAVVGIVAVVGLSARRPPRWAVTGLGLGLAPALVVRLRFLAWPDPFAALVRFTGLVTLSPILFVGLAVGFAWRSRRRRALALTALLFLLGAAGSYSSASAAGVHWGPRLLLPALVPLILLAAERLASAVRAARRREASRVVVAALLAGLVLGWVDTAYSWYLLDRARAHNAAVERFLATRPERLLATTLWWVPQLYARADAHLAFLLLQSTDDYGKFRRFAVSRGETAWLLATGRQAPPDLGAERLSIPGAPDRGTILDFRLYRIGPPAP
jgi:hypothetical protein